MSKSIVIRAPKIVVEEIENIKAEEGLMSNQEAFNKMVKFCQVGREAKRIYRLDFKWRRKL